MVQHWHVLCYFRFDKLKKKGNNVGQVTEKGIIVSTRTPEDLAIKNLRCIPRVAKKATVSFVVSCLSVFSFT